jgi:uncharacterized protein GlcG (DUF336 family)
VARPFLHAATVALLAAGGACDGSAPATAPPATLADVTVHDGSFHEAHMLRFDVAERIAAAFFDCGEREKKPRSLHIVDQFGQTIYAARMDGQFADNIDVARLKAQTALYFRENTRVWLNRGKADPLMALWTAQLGQFTSPTGLPVIVEGQLLGAVGVGGASGDCAHEALTAVLGPQPPLEPPPLLPPPSPASQ